MSKQVLEISKMFGRDSFATFIAHTWLKYDRLREGKIKEWRELRNYVFATDTTTTTNKSLPWKNSTTLPKLCQLRDNLHANYISSLFPNDNWLKWEAYSNQDAASKKTKAIEAYMSNKTRVGHFRTELSKLVYDYIDYGSAFGMPEYESSYIVNAKGERVVDYVGPKAKRISPLDIVFNPLAESFKDSWKIVRSIKSIGAIKLLAQNEPENNWVLQAITNRNALKSHMALNSVDSEAKAEGLLVDGFGSYSEYMSQDYVEFLDFYGDIHNEETGELEIGQHITVIDRMWVVRKAPFETWLGSAPIFHVGWRTRPDNLWAMGPLDNLVGLQYRLDHLENLKADAMDLGVMPPLVIKGEVEEFVYGPGEEIHVDETGSVTELAKNSQWVMAVNNQIELIEQKMEQYAGAPKEAMGIRTPGEKTMFEVQSLQNAAGRIFQSKVNAFEIEFLEPLLNGMLEVSRRNLDRTDVVRVIDDDLGVSSFLEITKEDITASGKIRPIGSRHFAAQSQLVQNLTGLSNTPIWAQIAPHVSAKKLAVLVEEVMGLGRHSLFSPHVAIFEQQETTRMANQAGEDLLVEAKGPVE